MIIIKAIERQEVYVSFVKVLKSQFLKDGWHRVVFSFVAVLNLGVAILLLAVAVLLLGVAIRFWVLPLVVVDLVPEQVRGEVQPIAALPM